METRTNDQWIEAFDAYLKRRYPGRTTAKHYVSDVRIFTVETQYQAAMDRVSNLTSQLNVSIV
jgi:hypothetical protein